MPDKFWKCILQSSTHNDDSIITLPHCSNFIQGRHGEVALKPPLDLEQNQNEYLELGINIGVLLYQVEVNAFKKKESVSRYGETPGVSEAIL